MSLSFRTILLAAALLAILGLSAPRVASACEDEERPVPCRLEKGCAGADRELCAQVAKTFCEQPGRCQDARTLKMDPRYCAALGQQIQAARRARTPRATPSPATDSGKGAGG